MNLLDTLFINRKIFNTATLLSAFCFLVNAVFLVWYNKFLPSLFGVFCSAALAACMIAVMLCTVKQHDNAVKGLFGIVFGVVFTYDLRFFASHFDSYAEFGTYLFILKLVLDVLLAVLYLMARDDPKGSSKFVPLCKIAFFVLMLASIANNLAYFVYDFTTPGNSIWLVQDFSETLAFILLYFSAISAACTVDKYKHIRSYYTSKGQWTEELRKQTKSELFGE